jgi:glycosyltransferase involved in cell wall biosynthesis
MAEEPEEMNDGESPGPVVDVGIPTHQGTRYLGQAIESILAQTFRSWRLTICENGPLGDRVGEILEPYLADPRIAHLRGEHAVDPSVNATRAITSGHAAYVALLHDDDLWDPEFLERRVAFLDSHPQCGLVFSHCKFIGPDGATAFTLNVNLAEGVHDRQTFLRTLYEHNIISIPTVLVRRSAYERVTPSFNKSLLFDDYEMWLRIAAVLDVGFLDVADASYRVHASQTTHKWALHIGEHRLALLDAVEEILPSDFPSRDRRRVRAGGYLRAAYDANIRGERKRALRYVLSALRAHPAAPIDPRMISLVNDARRFHSRQVSIWEMSSAGSSAGKREP